MNNRPKPLLSVIIPCLNEAGTVERLIEQLLNQKTSRLEIIVVDNGSTDQTLAVLESYKQPGLRVVSGVAEGVSRARNAGAAKARGSWLAFLDADTLLPDSFVADILQLLSSQPDFKLAAIAYKGQTKNIFFKFLAWAAQAYQRISYKLKGVPLIPGAVGLVRREIHTEIGGFNESIRYNEDFEYSKRAYSAAKSFKSLRHPHVYFSVRRLENGGWRKVVAVYGKAEWARLRGKQYDPVEYDMSDHAMK